MQNLMQTVCGEGMAISHLLELSAYSPWSCEDLEAEIHKVDDADRKCILVSRAHFGQVKLPSPPKPSVNT